MSPPRTPDAGSPPISSTDAAVPAETAVPADAGLPADASTTDDASAPTAVADAGSGPNPNPFRLRIGLEGGGAFTDMSNGTGIDHTGGYARAEVGFEWQPNRGDSVFVQGNAGFDLAWLSRDLGEGVGSSLNHQGIFLNGRVGYSLFGGNLRFSGGVDLGTAHVGAAECRDGLSCGAVFGRNPQLLPIDNWGFLFRPEIGISTLGGVIGAFVRGGWMFGVNPTFNVVDGGALDRGLNIPNLEVGLAVDVMAIVNLFTGGGSSRPAAGTEEPPAGSGSAAPVEPPAAEPVVEAPALTGLALVNDRRESASRYRAEATSASELVTSARAAFTAVSGTDAAAMTRRRVQAVEVLTQAQNAITAYNHIGDLITEARTTMEELTGADRNAANRAIQEMTNWQTEIRRIAGQAYRQGRQTAEDFNGMANHGEDISFTLVDPTPPAASGGRSGRGRTGRSGRVPVVPPVAPVAPPVAPVAPPVAPVPPVGTGTTGRTRADAGVPPSSSRPDAGPPVFIFGGGEGTGGTGGTARPDAGVAPRRPDE